ncbi:diguanylate cyclase [Cupriavidus malaysiensis]|uniref:Diguanylate cyclase n=1 Tax=Cupriavidus malaysiensis TaxID=367825 RepID=A0A1D9I7V1_9BURK|nr:diguanylate cyclase [Cupriavidus malaysiensis]
MPARTDRHPRREALTLDSILSQLSATLPAAKTIEQLTRPLLEMLGEVTGLESTYLTSVDLVENVQHVRFARNTGSMTIPEGLSVPWADTLCKRALDAGRMVTDDVPGCWGDSGAARQLGIQTYVSAPVRAEDGELLGTLCAASADRQPLPPAAQSVLQLFSSIVANFVEREALLARLSAANERLAAYALTDALTGLPNRRALLDELQRLLARAVRERSKVLVGCIDLDGFKAINDRYGHQAGDIFLQEVSRRLASSLRVMDMLSRIGGDEFVFVGPELAPEAGEAERAARLLQARVTAATAGHYVLGGQALAYDGASVGVVSLDPIGLSTESALKQADMRMYEVKRQRKRAVAH